MLRRMRPVMGDKGLFGGQVGLCCGDEGLFCGDVGLFCGYALLQRVVASGNA